MEHDVGVGRIKRRLEERTVDGLKEDNRRDALRFGIDKGLAQRMNHGADEEVAAELDGVRLTRLRAYDGEAATERRKQWTSLIDSRFRSGGDDPQSAFFGDVGTAEDRRGDKGLAAARVLGGEALGEHNADGAQRNVQRAGTKRIEYAFRAEENGFVGRVVEEHGEDRFSRTE